jgi:hypothetical protein
MKTEAELTARVLASILSSCVTTHDVTPTPSLSHTAILTAVDLGSRPTDSAPCSVTHSSTKETPEVWSKSVGRRFRDLVRKEALDQITETELAELETLQAARRSLVSPRTPEEIISSIRQQRAMEKLVSALNECVKSIA